MKTIMIEQLDNYRGGPLMVPAFDAIGDIVTEPILGPGNKPLTDSAGNPVTQPALTHGTIVDVLRYAMLDFPRDLLTMNHISKATKMLAALAGCKKSGTAEFHLEDEDYKWLVSVLRNDAIGVKMFGQNIAPVLTAIGAEV